MSKEELKVFMPKLRNRIISEFPDFNEPKITDRGECIELSLNKEYTFNIPFRIRDNELKVEVKFNKKYKDFIAEYWDKEKFAKEYPVRCQIVESYAKIYIVSPAYIDSHIKWDEYIEKTIENIHILCEISDEIIEYLS